VFGIKQGGPAALGAILCLSAAFAFQQPPPNPAAAKPSSPQRALLDRYCVTCHNQRLKTGGLALDAVNVDRVADDAETWEKVVRKLEGGLMPPAGLPRTDRETIGGFTTWLTTSLDRAAAARLNPGPAILHRLNRSEYANAIRDLLALEIDAKELLPPDDESSGFDNIAGVLKVSPSLLEQYLAASRKIAALAVGDPATTPVSQIYRIPPDLSQERHVEGLPMGTRGGVLIRHNFPLDAEYEFRVALLQNIVGYVTGLEWPHRLEISIDGEQVFLAPVGGEEDNKMSDANLGVAKDTLDARLKTRVPVKAGPHAVAVTFFRKNASESDEPLQPFTRDLDLQNMNGVPRIEHVQITGPLNATGPGDTASRRRIFTCRPASAAEEAACARGILSALARRAYRRPVAGTDLEALMSLYQAGRNRGNFERGIQDALELILANPKFLFRSEPDPANLAAGAVYRVGDLELASRLSFFLWSSLPDDTLVDLAAQGKLKDPAILEQQVKRMLADPKSEALIANFAGQWLFLRNLQSAQPDITEFPNFDDNLRQAMRRETELLFESLLREDRSVLDLLTADYTFVNERLARHYGIPNVYGTHFRRVKVPSDARRGLLGQGSILTVTSYPNRTSPVLRGKWILENLLGTPPPVPPAGVPPLKENAPGTKPLTVRQLMEEHRANQVCAACHRIMDPLGLALENFDAVGQWRTREAAGPIDATGQLSDGTQLDGVATLRQALWQRSGQFVATLTEKLLTYALGRGVEYYDMPAVRSIARESARDQYRFTSLVTNIAKSTPFQMKRVQEATLAAPSPLRRE
jgi:mono/diheme cytochrome c family protein